MSDEQPPLPLEISCAEVHALLEQGDSLVLIDCRETEEHAHVHLPASKLLPMSELVDRVDELTPHRDRQLVVHCHLGGRSLRVAQWLREQGFAHAQSMAGGIDQWAVEIDPSLPRYG